MRLMLIAALTVAGLSSLSQDARHSSDNGASKIASHCAKKSTEGRVVLPASRNTHARDIGGILVLPIPL